MYLQNASRLLQLRLAFLLYTSCLFQPQREVRKVIPAERLEVPAEPQNQPIEDSLESRYLLPRPVVPSRRSWSGRSAGINWQDPRSQSARHRKELTVRVRLRSVRRRAHE